VHNIVIKNKISEVDYWYPKVNLVTKTICALHMLIHFNITKLNMK